MTLSTNDYTFSTFNANAVLSGGICALYISGAYKLVEEFEKIEANYSLLYPYRALVEGVYYQVNDSGITKEGYYLFTANGIISSTGASAGDVITKASGSGEDVTTQSYTLTSLNYRETVAVQVLNALIYHYQNPLKYNNALIKLLVDKAFKFSIEFTNQAINLRVQNAEEIEETTTETT